MKFLCFPHKLLMMCIKIDFPMVGKGVHFVRVLKNGEFIKSPLYSRLMGYLDYPLCIYKQLLAYSLLHNLLRQIYYSLQVEKTLEMKKWSRNGKVI